MGDVVVGVIHSVEGNEDPEHVEEDKVHPHVHEVAAVEVDIADEPLRAKGHEAAVELAGSQDDHPEASLGAALGDEVGDVEGNGAIEEDGQEFQANDALDR